MNLSKFYPRLSFALVFTAIVAHCVAQHDLWLVLVAGMLAVLSRIVCEGPRGLVLPRQWSLLLTAIALVWCCIGIIGDPTLSIRWIGTFVVWLTVIKLYERRSVENEAERLILGLLLMVLASLVSIDLLFGLLLVGWTGLGITVLLLFQLYYGQELVRIERGTVASGATLPRSVLSPVTGLTARRDFRRLASLVLMAILMGSAVLFVLVPRSMTESLAKAAGGRAGESVSGYTSKVELGGESRISESFAEVMSVQLLDVSGSVVQFDEPLRLRGATLDFTRGDGVWVTSEHFEADWRNETEGGQWHVLQTTRSYQLESSKVLTQRFDLSEPLDDLFSMSEPLSIRTPVPIGIAYNNYTEVIEVSGDLAPLQYEIKALPGPPRGRPYRLGWTQYRNPVIQDLAVEILGEAGIPIRRPRTPAEAAAWNMEAAAAFRAYLVSGVFRYTLELDRLQRSRPVPDGMDPVEQFLLVDRVGHCEYFAAAFVSLCHGVDLNARIVTGFVTDRFDALSNRYVVLAADAHAWSEVESTPGTWITFDPTPEAWTPPGRQQPVTFSQRMNWIYRWFEGAWRANVLGFDATIQESVIDGALPWWSQVTSHGLQSVGEFMVTINLAFGFGPGGYIWMGVVLVLLLVGFFAWRHALRRRRAVLRTVALSTRRGRTGRQLARRYAFYADMLGLLEKAGHAKPGWQPPADFAESLRPGFPTVADRVQRIISRFYAMRFGGASETADEADRMQSELQGLASALEAGR